MNKPNIKEIDTIRKSGFRPGVVGCFLNDKKILFLFKEEYDLWQLPQGGIDNKESIEHAIIREMTEELGEKFTASMKIHSFVCENKIEFPNRSKNARNLKTDNNEEVFMEGKKYYFIAINTNITNLNINETEFDDYKWLNYSSAITLSETIHQKGKRRVTIDAINTLHSSGLL